MNPYNVMLNKMMLAADERQRGMSRVNRLNDHKVTAEVRKAYEHAMNLDKEAMKILTDLPRAKEVANADAIEIITDTCKNHGVALFVAVDTPGEYESRYICMICLYNLLYDLFNTEVTK